MVEQLRKLVGNALLCRDELGPCLEGGIHEERLGFGRGHLERLVEPGETIRFAPSYIHRFRPKDGVPTTSIHVYSPPLKLMGAYFEGEDGALFRVPMDGDEELVNLND